MLSHSRHHSTPTTNQSNSSIGEEISSEKLATLQQRIKVLELFFKVNNAKVEKKKKADTIAHLFNDDKEASFLVSILAYCGPRESILLTTHSFKCSVFLSRQR
jgi:hypothetical protein